MQNKGGVKKKHKEEYSDGQGGKTSTEIFEY